MDQKGLVKTLLLVGALLVFAGGFTLYKKAPASGEQCGGFAGALCPGGYSCEYEQNHPDALGTCKPNLLAPGFWKGLIPNPLEAAQGGDTPEITEDSGISGDIDKPNEDEGFVGGESITITSPSSYSSVSSPVEITGNAHGSWFFEGDFPVTVVVGDGEEVVTVGSGFVTAVPPEAWMTDGPVEFFGVVEFETSAESGYILLHKDNPSGLPENDLSASIPVNFSN